MSKQTHLLLPHHHAHLSALGIPWLRPPYLRCDKEEYGRAYKDWQKTHPHQSHEFLHMKALGHIAWAQHCAEQAKTQTLGHHDREIQFLKWVVGFLVLALLLAIARPAHAQFSHIDSIDIQNQGSDIGFFTFPFTVNFTGAGVSCANSAGVVTCTVTGGSITNNPGGVSTNVQYNNGGVFGGIANGTLGQVLISQGAGSAPAFADPLVQGTQAAASTTIPNPVVIGGSDYGGTAAVQTAKVTSAGALQTHETGTAAISAASLPLPTGAALDSSLTTIDTDVKANITLHAGTNVIGHVVADSGSTTAVTGTVAVSAASLPLPSGASTAAKQPALGTAGSASADVISIQGIASMTAVKVDGSAVTQPVSAASLPLPSGASTAAKQPALGAAGAASSDVISVQGIASMIALKVDGSAVTQPVSGTVTTTPPSNASTNVAQVAGTTTDTNSGTKSAGTLRVVLATDQPALTNKLLVTPDSVALPANQSVNLNQVAGAATSATNPLYIRETDGTNPVILDPCRTQANIFKPFSQTASAQLVTGTSAKKIYICSINLVTAAANNVAMVEGTGTVCATGIAGMAGGTTAATGWNFGVNGGLTQGNGMGSIMAEATNADNLCLLQSAAVQLSGVIGYVVQ